MADVFTRLSDLNKVVEANKECVIRMEKSLLTMTPEAQAKEQKQIAFCSLYTERVQALITALRGGIVSEIEAAENTVNSVINIMKMSWTLG
jgi:hypothetical protein